MRWWGYVVFVILSLGLSVISALCTFFNPLSHAFVLFAAPAMPLFGYDATVHGGFSSIGRQMVVSFLWPLTLAPLHWLNFRLFHWNGWGYAGLFVIVNVIIAFAVLLVNASS